jgi:hypothetical protein
MAYRCVEEGRACANTPALAIGSKFKGFGPEEERSLSKAEITEDHTIQQFLQIMRNIQITRFIDDCRDYDHVLEAVKHLRYSAKDVERFSIALAGMEEEFHPWKAGYLLSALIENGEEESYVIRTSHLSEPIDYLGYANRKHVFVDGDLGDYCCCKMKRGSFTIDGNVGDSFAFKAGRGEILIKKNAGHTLASKLLDGRIVVEGSCRWGACQHMLGGKVVVKGDVDDRLGHEMRGGLVIIEGNAGELVGGTKNEDDIHNMDGGEIHIMGEIGSLGNVERGKIYHKGELIVDK